MEYIGKFFVWIVPKIHQLETQIYYGVDQSRYHGSAVAVKNQNATLHKKRAACRMGPAVVRGCVADQESAATKQRATVRSKLAEL